MPSAPRSFTAIDFETADYGADSACAVGLVRVLDGAIVDRAAYLLRPPRPRVMFTHIHGLRAPELRLAPDFAARWAEIRRFLIDIDALYAHNAGFDQAVLQACLRRAGIDFTPPPFRCTVRLARRVLALPRCRLPDVCAALGIPLRHHDALSDAEACARIAIALESPAATRLSGP